MVGSGVASFVQTNPRSGAPHYGRPADDVTRSPTDTLVGRWSQARCWPEGYGWPQTEVTSGRPADGWPEAGGAAGGWSEAGRAGGWPERAVRSEAGWAAGRWSEVEARPEVPLWRGRSEIRADVVVEEVSGAVTAEAPPRAVRGRRG